MTEMSPQPDRAAAGDLTTRASQIGTSLDDLVLRCRTELARAVEAKQYARANHLRTRVNRLGGLRLDLREALVAIRRDPDAAAGALDHLAQEIKEISEAH